MLKYIYPRYYLIFVLLVLMIVGIIFRIALSREDAVNSISPNDEVAETPFPISTGTTLRILQWRHFVPAYDVWFDDFADRWGTQHGVTVTVDHINITELETTLQAEIDASQGHTLVELLFPPAAFIEHLYDLTDVNQLAQQRFGEQTETCRAASYLPILDSYYAFCHGYAPDPVNYRIDLWDAVGYPKGPATYIDLLEGGQKIREQYAIPVGLGMAAELDSEMAMRAVIWSFGGAVQDENENVVLHSPETVAAVRYMADLYKTTMADERDKWDPFSPTLGPASNNNGLIEGELSVIINSISAYRDLQKTDPVQASKIGFARPLVGPSGARFASAHTWQIYVAPNYVNAAELNAAKAFLLHLVAHYQAAVSSGELYNFPAFPQVVPDLDSWLAHDPYGSDPADKLKTLQNAEQWGVYIGYPGVVNPAVSEVFQRHVITEMVARVARGEMSAAESVPKAHQRVEAIFKRWCQRGLVGGRNC